MTITLEFFPSYYYFPRRTRKIVLGKKTKNLPSLSFINALVFGHSAVLINPDQYNILRNIMLVHYIGNNILIWFDDQKVASTVYSLIRHM